MSLDKLHGLRTMQLERERAQRQAALGRRAKMVLRGDLGPVLKRWVSATVLPVAARLTQIAEALHAGDQEKAVALSNTPTFGLPGFSDSPDLKAILDWALKDDHAEDLVLAVVGTLIHACASADEPLPLTRTVTAAANAARETALGQLLTRVQGAKAMMQIRRRKGPGWKQRKSMDSVGALLAGQVRSALGDPMEVPIEGHEVVSVMMSNGESRRIELRRPQDGDWALLEVARRVQGERDAHLSTWCSFAMLVMCCAQAEAGWFDLVKIEPTGTAKRRRHSASHGLVIAPEAMEGIKVDIDRWLSMGFASEPMVAPPEHGDYLSVKHREVAGGRGPMGMKTNAKDSASWYVASEVIANTAWSVPAGTLKALRESESIMDLARKCEPDDVRRESILTSYRRCAQDEVYLPIFMDFRGRVYTRSNAVTYQGRDLQKGLLCFPKNEAAFDGYGAAGDALVLHLTALYGNGYDKMPLPAREAFANEMLFYAGLAATRGDWEDKELQRILAKAEEPIQLLTALAFARSGTADLDRIACQIDGTCNGLQHLTAMFRDETAAPWVNLTPSTLDERPADLYAEVAVRVGRQLGRSNDHWASRLRTAARLDRKLCKRPVMVLPYGGTKQTIEDSMLEGLLEQGLDPTRWVHGHDGEGNYDPDWLEGKYGAFMERGLDTHPLFRLDAQRLGTATWDTIRSVLPRPMQAMQAFRDIAKYVGKRSLEWRVPFSLRHSEPLWVVQCKAKSERTGLKFKGLSLPSSVRSLKIRAGRDEVDAHAHVSGIIANLIHSLDAAHLALTAWNFRTAGGTGLGSIHDCLLARPSEMGLLRAAVREAFFVIYTMDPLLEPVRIRDPLTDTVEAFDSWYALAQAAGATFPDRGSWEPAEVLDSAWFFS